MINSYTNLQHNRNNGEKLQKLLNDFYALSHIKICVCDASGNEIAYAPEKHCAFCRYVNSSTEGAKACVNNAEVINLANKKRSAVIYNCHMGLIECVSPIFHGDNISGYVMIGQLRDEDASDSLSSEVKAKLNKYLLDTNIAEKHYQTVTRASKTVIDASLSVIEALASYLYLNDLISSEASLSSAFDRYVLENADGNLTVETVAEKLCMARTELYGFCKTQFGQNPAERIKKLRLDKACYLLANTNLSVTEISYRIGVCNYNYFSKIFKKEYGVTPSEYRKSQN